MVKSKSKLKIVDSIEIEGNSEEDITERARIVALKKGYLAFKLVHDDDTNSSAMAATVNFLGMED